MKKKECIIKNINKESKKKEILVIVAHPDDETIWMGGTLLKSKYNKTIISLCRKNDMDRFPRFDKACEKFKAQGYMSNLDDSEKGHYKEISSEDIILRIMRIIKNKKYDYLYTHGENGEYGHIRHIEIHNAINDMLKQKLITPTKVFFFSYIKTEKNSNINQNADKLIKLEKPYFEMKKHLIKEIYGFKEGSFEYESAREVEAYNIKK
jgi:LmbE family N-acetylglucosaminyl deacetylase